MNITLEQLEVLLILAALVAIVARRLKVPYTVGLVVAGLALGFLPWGRDFALTREMIFGFLLPPLIFEAAINVRWPRLRTLLAPVLILATIGVLISASVVAFGMQALAGWVGGAAWVFAMLIAATDPVSIIAMFKESKPAGRLSLLVESESLFNDGTAAVAFVLAVQLAQGESPSLLQGAWQFIWIAGGGLLAGLAVAGVAILAADRTDEHLVEIALTSVVAYGSFLLAEHFGASGVLAALAAGLVVGNVGHIGSFSDKGREAVETFWEYAAFVANSVVFLLIGVKVAQAPLGTYWMEILAAIGLVLLGRAISVYAIAAAISRTKWKLEPMEQHVLFWGGLRGALALALVLGLPAKFEGASKLVVVTFGVVAFSVLVQGITMKPLLKRAKTGAVLASD